MSDAHEAWVDRCARWEKLYGQETAKTRILGKMVRQRDTEIAALKAERELLRSIVADLLSSEDCWFDHSGNCQAHMWFDVNRCPHATAEDYFAGGAAAGLLTEEPQNG